MKVQILDTAEKDLVEGYWFYERQQPGLGAHFRNSIYADLHALERPQEFIESFTRTIIARWLRGFLLHCIIRFPDKQRLCARSLIAAATQRGSQNICGEHAHLKRDFLGMLSACRAFSSLVGYESRSWIRPRLLSKK